MEKKFKDGSFLKTNVIKTTPEDGFVPDSKIHSVAFEEDVGKFHKGHSFHLQGATDNPIVTRTFSVVFACFFWFVSFIFRDDTFWCIFGIATGFVTLIGMSISISRYWKEKKKKMKEESKK